MQYALYRSIPCLHSICSHKHNGSSSAPLIARYICHPLKNCGRFHRLLNCPEILSYPFCPHHLTYTQHHTLPHLPESAVFPVSTALVSIPFLSPPSFLSLYTNICSINLFRTFVRIIVSGVCRACLRKLLSDTKYEKKKNFCQCIRQQKFFFFHLLMN